MQKPVIPANEADRLAALDRLSIVNSPAEERFDRITRLAKQVFNVPIALVSLVTQDCQWFKSVQGLTANQTSRDISFCGHAILNDECLLVPDTLKDARFADNPLVTDAPFIRFYAGQPIKFDNQNIGTLCIIDTFPRKLTAADKDNLRNLAGWVETELRLTALSAAQQLLLSERDEIQRAALVDPLTKIWNRQGLDEILMSECTRAQRRAASVVLMLVDVDYIKPVNDRYGQVAGDMALREIAQRLRVCLRPADILARYGGDEFLIFATGDSSFAAQELLATRILQRISEQPIACGDWRFNLTVSIGFTSVQTMTTTDVRALLQPAAMALQAAKNNGRNRVEFQAEFYSAAASCGGSSS